VLLEWSESDDCKDGLRPQVLARHSSYEDTFRRFRWSVPHRFNIGIDACDRHADASGRLALVHLRADGRPQPYSFDNIRAASNRLANALIPNGIRPDDRAAILLPQAPDTALRASSRPLFSQVSAANTASTEATLLA
jgi:hypothetical protein